MSSALRVLYVEDSEDDVILLNQHLHASHYMVEHERVVTADAFRASLHRGGWDLIVADYSLRRFSGMEALSIALHMAPTVPFIVVSGVMGEAVAMECVQAGAADYVTKQNVLRFASVVARTLRDAHERRTMLRTEADLRQQRSLLSLIYDNTSDILVLQGWDAEGQNWRVLSVNRSGVSHLQRVGLPIVESAILGRTVEEVIRVALSPFGDTQPLLAAFNRTADTGRGTTVEHTLTVAGRPWHFELTLVYVHGPDGLSQYVLSVIRDVTARKQAEDERRLLEQQRAESQKMAALGQLAGGVAHDFNNILMSILGFGEVIQRATSDDAIHSSAGEIVRGARRARELVRQILMFSRRKPTERKPVPLDEIVQEALQLLRNNAPAHVQWIVHLPSALPPVLGDATQLHQVVMNLVTNAVQAFGTTPGMIEIELTACRSTPNDGLAPSQSVRLTVRDNGPGMSQDVLDRLFEPFFTTKAPGDGTGLGLSVVYGIVQNHQGVIDVRSQLGQGTTFEILLPCATAPEMPGETLMPMPTAQGMRILFVDDESSITRLVNIMLKTMQHVPTVFDKSEAALAHFTTNANAFDLIITDLTMPGLTGVEFARGIRAVRQDIPIILSSGFPDEVPETTLRELGIVEVLQKPFQMQTLGEAIARQQR